MPGLDPAIHVSLTAMKRSSREWPEHGRAKRRRPFGRLCSAMTAADAALPGRGAARSGATLIRGPAFSLKHAGSRVCGAPLHLRFTLRRARDKAQRIIFKFPLDYYPSLIYLFPCPPRMRGREPVAPARGQRAGVRGFARRGLPKRLIAVAKPEVGKMADRSGRRCSCLFARRRSREWSTRSPPIRLSRC